MQGEEGGKEDKEEDKRYGHIFSEKSHPQLSVFVASCRGLLVVRQREQVSAHLCFLTDSFQRGTGSFDNIESLLDSIIKNLLHDDRRESFSYFSQHC